MLAVAAFGDGFLDSIYCALMLFLLFPYQHSFLRGVESNLPIVQLIKEAKADVIIDICDVDSQDNLVRF